MPNQPDPHEVHQNEILVSSWYNPGETLLHGEGQLNERSSVLGAA